MTLTSATIEHLKRSLELLSQNTALFEAQATESEDIYRSKHTIKAILYKSSANLQGAQIKCFDTVAMMKDRISELVRLFLILFANQESELALHGGRIAAYAQVWKLLILETRSSR